MARCQDPEFVSELTHSVPHLKPSKKPANGELNILSEMPSPMAMPSSLVPSSPKRLFEGPPLRIVRGELRRSGCGDTVRIPPIENARTDAMIITKKKPARSISGLISSDELPRHRLSSVAARAGERWGLNSVEVLNSNNRTTVGSVNNSRICEAGT